jgi:uncharacterized membrane protein
MFKTLARNTRVLAPLLSLGATAALSIVMVLVRYLYTGQFAFLPMIFWNGFLAWIPLFCALLIGRARGRFALLGLTATWLLFLPNAPYVLTDLIHFRVGAVPYWYDLIMLIAFVWSGTVAGLLSLYLMQLRIRESWGARAGWLFAIVALWLSSFGIYLGRFLRFNSWDVVTNPDDIVSSIWQRMRHPFAHPRTYVFTLLLGLFLIGAYSTLVTFAHVDIEKIALKD